MPHPEAYAALKSGKTEWESYRNKAFKSQNSSALFGGRIDLRSSDLSTMNLSGYDLSRVDFSNEQDAMPTALNGANLSHTSLFGSKFSSNRLTGVDFSHANLMGAIFENIVFDKGCYLVSAKANYETQFKSCHFTEANLSNANFEGVDLSNTSFEESNLEGTNFSRSLLSHSLWNGARINKSTLFKMAVFKDHLVIADQSETISLPPAISWKDVRWISSFHLFPLSLLAMTIGVFMLIAINMNTDIPALIRYQTFHHTPLLWLIVSSAIVCVGGLFFKVNCPDTIQNFSESYWVCVLGHPRQFYLSASLKDTRFAPISGALCAIGTLLFLLFSAILFVEIANLSLMPDFYPEPVMMG